MRFSSDVRKCVVFLGHPIYGDGPTSVAIQGTGFYLGYDGYRYLVTARHVATLLEETTAARVNTKSGGSVVVVGENLPWVYHPDPTVDVGVVAFGVPEESLPSLDIQDLPETMLLTEGKAQDRGLLELGDLCYTVGLFRVLSGNERNLPVIHTGNLARLAGEELIPIKDPSQPTGTVLVDSHLVETQSLSGLSGSPVFVRHSVSFGLKGRTLRGSFTRENMEAEILEAADAQDTLLMVAYLADVGLLGLFQGAWEAPAGDVLAMDRGGRQITVPVGMGVVVPAARIIEVLELPKMKAQREEHRNRRAQGNAATPLSVDVSSPPANDANPTHREDFMRLVDVAGRKPEPKD